MKPTKRNWKLERASVHRQAASRSKSNKFTKNDSDERPEPGSRSKVWVGAYTRSDGRHVEGHFRHLKVASSR